ncbi:MAG: hypothetical protein Q7S02_01835 [bacterium]|nr:hypothetical protein [bacterium]
MRHRIVRTTNPETPTGASGFHVANTCVISSEAAPSRETSMRSLGRGLSAALTAVRSGRDDA